MIVLSIIILFCDKDVCYLKDILRDIKEKIKVKHEIILVDNREKDKSNLPKGNYKIVSKGYNTYQFEGRRMGLDEANGIFVWYVDVDDSIIGELTNLDFRGKSNADIIQLYTKDDTRVNFILPMMAHDKDLYYFGNGRLWSRLLSTRILKAALKPIKRDIKFMGYEDSFLFSLMYEHSQNIDYIDKFVYQYNSSRSTRNKNNFTKEKFDELEAGIENLEYLSSFLKKPQLFIEAINKEREIQRNRIPKVK